MGYLRPAASPRGRASVEYLGERIGHREANRRYAQKAAEDNHTFLFVVDRGIVIDAGTDGNDARFINHGCDPNCESVIEDRRVFIDALRTIQPGEELTYDYSIARDRDDPPNIDEVFACHCGVERCRGTMLWPRNATQAEEARQAGEPVAVAARACSDWHPADEAQTPVAASHLRGRWRRVW